MYGELKKQAAAAVVAFAQPYQDRVNELMNDRAELERLMKSGADRASAVAAKTLEDVYSAIGFAR
jgi:tryptophanyl-tRNA synthetase